MPRAKTTGYSAPVKKFRNGICDEIIRYNDRYKQGARLSVEKRQYLAWIIDNKCMELERTHAGKAECEAARKEIIRQMKMKGGETKIEPK